MIEENVYSNEVIDAVCREIHWYMSYATLSTYHAMLNAMDSSLEDEKREESAKVADMLVMNAESLYDDLNDEQKALMKTLALKLLKIVEN